MRRDIFTTMPRAGYSHTGKRVALTTSGEMFLGPNAIETMLWSSAGVNVADHGKTAYKEAIALFASKYLPGVTPDFIEREAAISELRSTTYLGPTFKPSTGTMESLNPRPGGKWK